MNPESKVGQPGYYKAYYAAHREKRTAESKAYYLAHREELRAQQHAYYVAHAEERKAYVKVYNAAHREKIRARGKAYCAAHLEEIKARGKAYYDAHREEERAKRSVYNLAHQEQSRTRNAVYRAAHREELRVRARAYYLAHREQTLAHRRAWHAAHPEYQRGKNLQRYGISQDDFLALLEKQGGRCKICGTNEFNSQGPMVDHDHVIGHVRGILCHNCNRMLGNAKDLTSTLEAGADYLSRAEAWWEDDLPPRLREMMIEEGAAQRAQLVEASEK